MEKQSELSQCICVDDLRNLVGELRMMARRFLLGEGTHSFTPTALAMTALRRAKLSEQDWSEVRWENRAHFFSSLNTAMRHALIDHARRRNSKGRENVFYFSPDEDIFRDLPGEAEERPERFMLLDEALSHLSAENRRLSETVEQFYFLGYSIPEIAKISGVSEKTVDRDLLKARTFLKKYLDDLPRAT